MVAQGITRARLPARQRRDLHVRRSGRAGRARATRQYALGRRARIVAAAIWKARRGDRQCADRALSSARYARRRAPKPALILGFPVGFVGAAESKAMLADDSRGVPYRRRAWPARRQCDGCGRCERAGNGDRINDAQQRRLYGLGVGPGDPELITLKALRLLRQRPWSRTSSRRARRATRSASSKAHLHDDAAATAARVSRHDRSA